MLNEIRRVAAIFRLRDKNCLVSRSHPDRSEFTSRDCRGLVSETFISFRPDRASTVFQIFREVFAFTIFQIFSPSDRTHDRRRNATTASHGKVPSANSHLSLSLSFRYFGVKKQDTCSRWDTFSFLDLPPSIVLPRSTIATDKLWTARVWKLHTPLQRASPVCSNRLGHARDARRQRKGESRKNRRAGKGESTCYGTNVQTGNPLRIGLVSPAWQTYDTQDSSRLGYSSWLRNEMYWWGRDVSSLPLKLRPWTSPHQVELVLENISDQVAHTCHAVHRKTPN